MPHWLSMVVAWSFCTSNRMDPRTEIALGAAFRNIIATEYGLRVALNRVCEDRERY